MSNKGKFSPGREQDRYSPCQNRKNRHNILKIKNLYPVISKRLYFLLLFLLGGGLFPLVLSARSQGSVYPREMLAERISRIAEDYSTRIAFDNNLIARIEVSTLDAKSLTLEEALGKSLYATGFIYKKLPNETYAIARRIDQPTKGVGILKGRIVEAETSEPLPGATIVIADTQLGTTSDANGYYLLEKVPEGKQTIEVSFIGYTKRRLDVRVRASETATYDVTLSVDNKQIDEVVISGIRRERSSVPHASELLVTQEIKNLQVVSSGISSELISKSADRNAAQAVQRVSGVSIVDDKFVVVRGLNPRYNLTYLNDNVAPSTETNSRAFALDLIPSRVIDKIMVYKSPSPENMADATGGVVKVYTKDARAVKHFDMEFQLGVRPGTTFQSDFLTYNGGKLDFLGFDDGTRVLPSSVPGYGSLVRAQLSPSEYAKTFNPTLSYGKKTALPNMQFTANYYDAWDVLGKTLSMLTSFSYKNENLKAGMYRQQGIGYESIFTTDKMSDEDRNTNTVQTNLLQNFTYKLNENNVLFFKNFLLQQGVDVAVSRISQNTTNLLWNESYARDMDITLSYNQRFLYAGNLGGSHIFGSNKRHELKWNGGYTFSRQETPDQRVIRMAGIDEDYTVGDADLQWRARGYNPKSDDDFQIVQRGLGIISRIWSRNSEGVYNGSMDYNYKITPWLTAKTGTFHQWKSRAMDRRIYTLHEANIEDPDANIRLDGYVNPTLVRFRLQDLPNVWNETYLNDEYTGLQVHDRTSGSDTYRGTEQNNSVYLLLNITPANRFVEIYGGMRYEYNRQKIAVAVPPGNTSGLNIPILVDNPTRSWLPSVSSSLRPFEQWVFRASYGKTVNRTEFREVSPFKELDFENNTELRGNPDLKSALISNYDIRLEFYPNSGVGDMISAGAFCKDITNPIERINTSNRVESMFPSISYNNASSATVKGLEVELRKSLGFVPGRFFRNLSVVANGSLIESNVKFDEVNPVDFIVTNRPLQGQAPYLLNAGSYYDNAGWGTKMAVIYNTSGENIYAAGRGYKSNSFIEGPEYRGSLIELPRHLLDFSCTQRIGKGLQLKFTVQNLLNEAVTIIEDYNFTNKYEPLKETGKTETGMPMGEGDNISSRYNPGRYFTLSISYSL